jgi:SNF2 family DNA or RNA helicase
MGLGKTLTALALILANPPPGRDYTKPFFAAVEEEDMPIPDKKPSKTALQKVKVTHLQNVLHAAGVHLPADAKKKDIVQAIQKGLEDQSITLRQYYTASQAPSANEVSKSQTTLVVCPVSVMSNWQHQIETHLAPGTLRVAFYHGANRNEILSSLDQIDVLISSCELRKRLSTINNCRIFVAWLTLSALFGS